MLEGDLSSFSVGARFLSIVASIVIGGFLVLQTYENAVERRHALVLSLKNSIKRKLLRHTLALFCNILFLWLLQVSIIVLCVAVLGFDVQMLLESKSFIVTAFAFGAPIIVQALRGKTAPNFLSRRGRR